MGEIELSGGKHYGVNSIFHVLSSLPLVPNPRYYVQKAMQFSSVNSWDNSGNLLFPVRRQPVTGDSYLKTNC